MKIETIAIHAANHTDPTSKAVIQPIILSTTFERAADGTYPGGHIYSRSSNPNRSLLENVLAKLEGGIDAAAFSSGNAAGMSVFQSLPPGTHIIAPDDMYHGLRNQLKNLFAGILTFDFIDVNNPEVLQNHIKPETGLLWIETPSNPLLKVTDIKKAVEIARKHNLKVVCDNTFATPVCQQPLSLGADLVMHSSTQILWRPQRFNGRGFNNQRKICLVAKNTRCAADGRRYPFADGLLHACAEHKDLTLPHTRACAQRAIIS